MANTVATHTPAIEVLTFLDGGINWNWYAQAELNHAERTARVLFYARWHKFEESRHPLVNAADPRMEFLTTDQRVVYGLRVLGQEYLVLNPAHLFDYRDMTQLVLEGK